MSDDLYERDVLIWSEQQADLLRRLAAGDKSVMAAIDWENVVEEVENVGRHGLIEFGSFLMKAMLLLMRARVESAEDWGERLEGEVLEAALRDAPSVRERVDLQDEYESAVHIFAADYPEQAKRLPDRCPFTLDDLLVQTPDIAALSARLR